MVLDLYSSDQTQLEDLRVGDLNTSQLAIMSHPNLSARCVLSSQHRAGVTSSVPVLNRISTVKRHVWASQLFPSDERRTVSILVLELNWLTGKHSCP